MYAFWICCDFTIKIPSITLKHIQYRCTSSNIIKKNATYIKPLRTNLQLIKGFMWNPQWQSNKLQVIFRWSCCSKPENDAWHSSLYDRRYDSQLSWTQLSTADRQQHRLFLAVSVACGVNISKLSWLPATVSSSKLLVTSVLQEKGSMIPMQSGSWLRQQAAPPE